MGVSKKGQGALEYLMTYGWAILVVMVVGIVLWYLGVFFGGPGDVNTASGFAKIKPLESNIKYYDHTYGLFGDQTTLRFTLVNGVGTLIIIQNITMDGDCDWQSDTHRVMVDLEKDGTVDEISDYFELIAFSSITHISFPVVNVTTSEATDIYLIGCNSKAAGQSFSVPITITYTHTVAGQDIERQEIGTISGSAE